MSDDMVIRIEYEDRTIYTLNGVIHREDGPAVELVNGDKQYWVNGEYLDFITNDQALIYHLKYGFLK